MAAIKHALAKLRWSLHHRGVLGTLRASARALTHKHNPGTQQLVHPFDRRHGVETGGFITAVHLTSGHPHDLFSTGYCGVAPSRFRAILDRWSRTQLERSLTEYTFIDVGCGKGRALMLASEYPFREILGVELSPGLAETAQANLNLWRATHPSAPIMTAVCADATQFEIPEGPCLLFVYKPFAESIQRKFLEHVQRTISARPRPLDILFCNPVNDSAVAAYPGFQRLWSEMIPIAAEDVPYTPTGTTPELTVLYRHIG